MTRRRRRTNYWVLAPILTILFGAMTVSVFLLLWPMADGRVGADQDNEIVTEKNTSGEALAMSNSLERINFQPVIDEWASTSSGDVGVYIYDLDIKEEVGKYNPEEEFQTASLYKLFVVYEGYKMLESGEWLLDDMMGRTGYTVGECLDLAIRESNSACAETIWEEIGEDKMQEIIREEYGLEDTNIDDFASTPKDIAKMMEIFYLHEDIHDADNLARMKDSFLNQPATEYDWRQGLPSGFGAARVYNKVGWDYSEAGYWNIYNDAAIVEFPDQNRHYAVVVMTNGMSYPQIKKLGKMLEEKFFSTY